MSLLLDARKKSQQAASNAELSLEPLASADVPADTARSAGRNLFNAKIPSSSQRPSFNRGLLYAAGSTAVLLAAGAGYVWYATATPSQPTYPMTARPVQPAENAVATPVPPATRNPAVQPSAIVDSTKEANAPTNSMPANRPGNKAHKFSAQRTTQPLPTRTHSPDITTAAPNTTKGVHVAPQTREQPDPLLNRAYAAYRSGKLDEAQQLYAQMLNRDAQNTDALSGLAAIAQQRGENGLATQYYLRILNLDPRNAVANAGMSALSADDHHESRLKNLIREQGNSAALHFALGNLYAEQSRWSEAQQSYFNAYLLDAKNANLAFNLAVSLEHLGQNKLAADYYQRALQLDPSGAVNFDRAKITQHITELTR